MDCSVAIFRGKIPILGICFCFGMFLQLFLFSDLFPQGLFSVLGILIKSYAVLGKFCGIFMLENLAPLFACIANVN